jgi:tRNA uridine 5-carboxymethylaminomethyl modification enzyme
MFQDYDVIVVGAGHAGCEAAAATANLGSKTLLITMNLQTIAQMSCNPAMGGVAKGQIVREIDAMGGYSGIISDKTAIQFRMLNRSKGPAMWSPRAQIDRYKFHEEWRYALENINNLDFFQDTVSELIVEDGRVCGVKTSIGLTIRAKAVILTNGTFLNGLIHIGEKSFGGGRMGDKSAKGLTEDLIKLGFESGRMKTGTPPRIDSRSINYSVMEEQKGDENPERFSYLDFERPKEVRSCYITHTSQEVHDILKEGFERSPMFTGRIKGLGPRYCPSVEDKINRFADKDKHQIFVEPEGLRTIEVYVNGFSTSLPEEIQYKALTKVRGFENAKFLRPGYAIEYDYFPPMQLYPTLETKIVPNLYFAGQINGTTGYEEAAAQGFMAGINAHRKINELEEVILKRSEAYIGVLIDDLVTKGTDEPYRMFTSRAEHRLLLRQDNADVRLTKLAYDIGLANQERMDKVNEKIAKSEQLIEYMKTKSIEPKDINSLLTEKETSPLSQTVKLITLLTRPQLGINDLVNKYEPLKEYVKEFPKEALEQAEINTKYESYFEKEEDMISKQLKMENKIIHPDFDYDKLSSLSIESRQKLKKIKPRTLGQASRISGVSPADISVLMVGLTKH